MGNLIPIVGILFPVFIIFIVFYFVFTTDYKKEKLKREERMKAIEKGIEILNNSNLKFAIASNMMEAAEKVVAFTR